MVGKNPNLVSVVVNCHNSERFIEECIASITKQSYQNFEIIIWDNKSDDATASIVHELSTNDARIKYFRGESFVPLGAARNLAMQKCGGSWIAFLDSDDLWDHDFLFDQMSALAGKEKTSFGFGFVTEFFQDSKTIPNFGKEKKQIQTEISIFEKLLKGNFIYFSSLVFSREALNFLKNFKEEFVQAEDYELLLRLADKFDAIQTGHAYYRLHNNNLSKRQTAELYVESLDILKIYLKYRRAKISFAFNLANFAIFCVKSKNYFLFIRTIRLQRYNLGYLFSGLGIFTVYRTIKFLKVIRKKLLLV
jgi:glycosyltransferase involved in cell wall biosynthesis